MKVLIIGLGSIAKKHIEVLRLLRPQIEIYALRSRRSSVTENNIINLYDPVEIGCDFDFAIISNPTSLHYTTIETLAKIGLPLFIEKPVLASVINSDYLIDLINKRNIFTYVACNLRFHPAIEFLKSAINAKMPLEFTAYCGSYLPTWRPGLDYRYCYSAIKSFGGGVHLDLIHEIDYTIYLLGYPKNVQKYLKRKSSLEINTPDIAHYSFEYEHLSAFITLNYYRTDPRRTIECVWDDISWSIDLLKNEIVNSLNEIVYFDKFCVMDTYLKQMDYFINCLTQGHRPMNSIDEAIKIMKTYLDE